MKVKAESNSHMLMRDCDMIEKHIGLERYKVLFDQDCVNRKKGGISNQHNREHPMHLKQNEEFVPEKKLTHVSQFKPGLSKRQIKREKEKLKKGIAS